MNGLQWFLAGVGMMLVVHGVLRLVRRKLAGAAMRRGKAEEAVERLVVAMAPVPGLIDGLTELCRAMCKEADELKKLVDLLTAAMSPVPSGYEDDSTPEAQDRIEVRDLVRRGIPEDAARKRVREKRIYTGIE